MSLWLDKIKVPFPQFNEREHDADDFWRLAALEKIKVSEERLLINGYYKVCNKKPCILINSDLPPMEWLITAFHELVHHYLDVTYKKSSVLLYRDLQKIESKQEERAEDIAHILVVPAFKLKELELTPFDQLHPFTQKVLIKRQRIFEKYKEKGALIY